MPTWRWGELPSGGTSSRLLYQGRRSRANIAMGQTTLWGATITVETVYVVVMLPLLCYHGLLPPLHCLFLVSSALPTDCFLTLPSLLWEPSSLSSRSGTDCCLTPLGCVGPFLLTPGWLVPWLKSREANRASLCLILSTLHYAFFWAKMQCLSDKIS